MGGKVISILFVVLISKSFGQDLAFPKAEEGGKNKK